MKKLTLKSVADALRQMKGNISAAAERLQVTRKSVYSFIERHPPLASVLMDCRLAMGDKAESAVYEAIEGGESVPWPTRFAASKWYLACQCKDRGYIEREQDFDGSRLTDAELETLVRLQSKAAGSRSSGT